MKIWNHSYSQSTCQSDNVALKMSFIYRLPYFRYYIYLVFDDGIEKCLCWDWWQNWMHHDFNVMALVAVKIHHISFLSTQFSSTHQNSLPFSFCSLSVHFHSIFHFIQFFCDFFFYFAFVVSTQLASQVDFKPFSTNEIEKNCIKIFLWRVRARQNK